MRKVKINFKAASPHHLHIQVNTLCKQLEHPFISRKNARELSRKLDLIFAGLFEVGAQNVTLFEKMAFQEIENKIISLYKRLDDAWIERQISEIQKEASSLKEALTLGIVSAEAVDLLKQHIHEFTQDHRACIADRQVIADARRTIEMATTPNFSSVNQPAIHLLNDELEEGQFEEILEIAHAFYDGKLIDAKRGYNQLPPHHQQRIQEHATFLGGVLFVDYWKTLQTLCATVNELVGNGELYPSQDLIEDIFTELNKLSQPPAQIGA